MDGDTVGIKGVWLQESNEELDKYMKSKLHYINLGASNIRLSSNEAMHSIYCITKVIPIDKTKLTDPVF